MPRFIYKLIPEEEMIRLKNYFKKIEPEPDSIKTEFILDAFELYKNDPKHYMGIYAVCVITSFFMLILGSPWFFAIGISATLIHSVVYMITFLSMLKRFKRKWS